MCDNKTSTLIGTIAGGYFGGTAGALAGASIGSQLTPPSQTPVRAPVLAPLRVMPTVDNAATALESERRIARMLNTGGRRSTILSQPSGDTLGG